MSKLYTPRLLSLAAELANYPISDEFPLSAEARSRTCGSTIRIGFDTDADGRVTRAGMLVSACAIGQASAAILAKGINGRTLDDVSATLGAIEMWLAGEGNLPDWPGIEAVEPAREHKGRHGALLMPWQAAVSTASLSSTGGTG